MTKTNTNTYPTFANKHLDFWEVFLWTDETKAKTELFCKIWIVLHLV